MLRFYMPSTAGGNTPMGNGGGSGQCVDSLDSLITICRQLVFNGCHHTATTGAIDKRANLTAPPKTVDQQPCYISSYMISTV